MNIPHDGDIDTVSSFLQDRTDESIPPSQFTADLAAFVLKYNYFNFEKEIYLQVKGTAKGSTFAPNYANLYVGLLEKWFIFKPQCKSILQTYYYIITIARL